MEEVDHVHLNVGITESIASSPRQNHRDPIQNILYSAVYPVGFIGLWRKPSRLTEIQSIVIGTRGSNKLLAHKRQIRAERGEYMAVTRTELDHLEEPRVHHRLAFHVERDPPGALSDLLRGSSGKDPTVITETSPALNLRWLVLHSGHRRLHVAAGSIRKAKGRDEHQCGEASTRQAHG